MSLGHTQQLTPSSVNCPPPTIYNWPSLVLDRNLCVVGAPLQSIRSPKWSLTAEMSFDQGWPPYCGGETWYTTKFYLGLENVDRMFYVICVVSMFDSTAGFIPLHDVFEPLKTVLAWQFPIFLLATSWSLIGGSQSNFNHGLTRFCTHNM